MDQPHPQGFSGPIHSPGHLDSACGERGLLTLSICTPLEVHTGEGQIVGRLTC